MECNDAAQKLTLVSESEAKRNTKEPGKTRATGIFLTKRHWEKDNRVREAKSFKRLGRVDLVEVGPKPLTRAEKARYGPLVYRPYLKQRRERFKNREVKPVMLCVRPYMTSIFPVCEGPRRSEKKLETKRGRIKGFTRKSRARQIRKIMGLEVLPDIFSSLTYDDSVIEKLCDLPENRDKSSAEIMDEKIHADIHRMSSYIRKKFPGVWFCWRVEWEARKWGRFKGLIVPHWHGLWGGPVPFEILRQIVAEKWLDYTGTKNPDAFAVTHKAKSFIKLNGKRNIFY